MGTHKKCVSVRSSVEYVLYAKDHGPIHGSRDKGNMAEREYQRRFYQKATEVYRPFVEEYNQIMKELNAEKRLQEYIVSLNGSVPEGDLLQFAKDSAEQFTPILL